MKADIVISGVHYQILAVFFPVKLLPGAGRLGESGSHTGSLVTWFNEMSGLRARSHSRKHKRKRMRIPLSLRQDRGYPAPTTHYRPDRGWGTLPPPPRFGTGPVIGLGTLPDRTRGNLPPPPCPPQTGPGTGPVTGLVNRDP